MSTNVAVDPDRDYQVQLALLKQQNKKRTGAAPDPTLSNTNLDGHVGNLFLDGSVLNEASLQSLDRSDPTLMHEFSTNVHIRLPMEYKTGPDLEQCFCGYFCFDAAKLDEHLAGHPENEEAVAGLIRRLNEADVDPVSRQRFLDLIQEKGARASL